MNKEEKIKFEKKIKEEAISREDELIDAAKRNAAIVSEFLIGAKWADQHPKKGLWDAEKVVKWILNNYGTYEQLYTDNSGNHTYSDFQIGQFIRNLRKAMED